MSVVARHKLKIRYDGGVADDNILPLYDGTTSIQGISQAIQITTHAYLNNQIVSRATASKGAKFYLRPAGRGSFLFEIVTLLEQYPATSAAAVAVSAPVFYDFLKVAFKKATGFLDQAAETHHVQYLMQKDEPFFDELAETLEGSLQRVHRPIGVEINTISIERPRSKIVSLDSDSKDWVNTREEAQNIEQLTGNVTRFNSVTRNGRVFIDQIGRIVPFKPDGDFSPARLGYLTWSLHGSNTELPKKLKIDARKIRSAKGETKRLLISDCDRDE